MNLESQKSKFNSIAHCFSNDNDLRNHSRLLWTCKLWFRRSEWSPRHSLCNRAPGNAKAAGPQNSKTLSGKALVCLLVPEWFLFPPQTVNLNGRLFPFHSILHLLWDVVPANKESSVVEAAGCKGWCVVSRVGIGRLLRGLAPGKGVRKVSLWEELSIYHCPDIPWFLLLLLLCVDHTQESQDFYDISPPVAWMLLWCPVFWTRLFTPEPTVFPWPWSWTSQLPMYWR